jgi:hypothetical protein
MLVTSPREGGVCCPKGRSLGDAHFTTKLLIMPPLTLPTWRAEHEHRGWLDAR